MITRLEVDGFKSLRNFAVDLEPFTVFVGPNSAGKSNILEALGLLSRLARMPIVEAFKGGRGKTIDQFTRTSSGHVDEMRFGVEFLEYGWYPAKDEFQSRFRYELSIKCRETKRGTEQLFVTNEQIHAMRRDGDKWITEHPEFQHWAGYNQGGESYLVTLMDGQTSKQRVIVQPKAWPKEWQVPRGYAALGAMRFELTLEFHKTLASFRTFSLDSLRLGLPSERTDIEELAPDASNLPTILAELPDPALGAIRANLSMLVPGIASFDIIKEGNDFAIEFEFSGGEHVPARLVSNGTLRTLALLTALYLEPRPPIVSIEEPENGIFPGRLRLLLEKLRQVATEDTANYVQRRWENARESMGIADLGININHLPTQILITTHSNVILSALLSRARNLRFIDMIRRNSERVTRARTVGPVQSPQDGRFVISPKEIEGILDTTYDEAAE